MSEETKHDRRQFLKSIGAATTMLGIPLAAACSGDQAKASHEKRFDGKLRLPPGQKLAVPVDASKAGQDQDSEKEPQALAPKPKPTLEKLDARHPKEKRLPPGQKQIDYMKDMGGDKPSDMSRNAFSLRVHGDVENELNLSFLDLFEFPKVELTCDVHCVTRWSLFDTVWKGVRVRELAEAAKIHKKVGYVIFECAHGYTANIDLQEALKDNVLITWQVNGAALGQAHGAPVRSLVPDRYYWKSAKWLTGIRFQRYDEPGFWEVRGYHNHADPWLEERYS